MSSQDKEAQEDELLALASIYDEDEFKRADSAQGGETRICLELPQNFKIFGEVEEEEVSGTKQMSIPVKELVGEELFARYDRLLLQSSLDLMADVVYCPRPCCQTPVMQEPGCTMGICSSCNYAFCTLCKMSYHGVSPCKVTA
ncbi:hypothetical protein KIL84_016104, partial [Mauremys mutica]